MNRDEWIKLAAKAAFPVLENLSKGKLRKNMPLNAIKGEEERRAKTSHLEAFARTFSGIAPWLELGEETTLPYDEQLENRKFAELTLKSFQQMLTPVYPDCMYFDLDRQNLVDAGYLALGVLRAPKFINKLATPYRKTLKARFESTRKLNPSWNNWLLFPAVIELAIQQLEGDWIPQTVETAVRTFDYWYLGDGFYGDGPIFQMDYYNSFVIHPFLSAILTSPWVDISRYGQSVAEKFLLRTGRYAEIQMKSVAEDGSYPLVGRSLAYRCGAFHALADESLRGLLHFSPNLARRALSAAVAKSLCDDAFDGNGWLVPGISGRQPDAVEPYISTGSLYMCMNAFLPLGIPQAMTFWKKPKTAWPPHVKPDVSLDRIIEW